MRLLLDTEIVLLSLIRSRQLSTLVTTAFLAPGNSFVLSVVTPWEIAIKMNAGKLELPVSVQESLDLLSQQFPYEVLPVNLAHTLAMIGLPRIHDDPFDRMLVAQAQVEGLTIVTSDRKMAGYDVPVLW